MKEELIKALEKPRDLEKLYRENKADFKKEFNALYPEIKENLSAQIWNERINYSTEDISWGSGREILFVIIAAFLAGLIAKIPDFTAIENDFFYPRNVAFIIFPLLTAYFAWKNKSSMKHLLISSGAFILSACFINLHPGHGTNDTLILSCLHLPMFLWTILGFVFVDKQLNRYDRRIDFLKFNGDLLVITAVILISGGILTGITLGLFSMIHLRIEEFYFRYIVIWGLAATPIVGTFLVTTNPQLVHKVSPIIAKVFTPLVLVTLVSYLIAVIYTGKNPYNDRAFLLIFNLMLIGVMSIILFSVTESSKSTTSKINSIMLFCLSFITIIINGIALSAILFRISEWGFSPNRLAVLGGNILILTNLLMVSYRLFRTIKNNEEIEKATHSIAYFLPIYSVWSMVVTFVFPVIFHFK